MRLNQLTHHFVLTVNEEEPDIPDRLEVRGKTGERIASYLRTSSELACQKGSRGYRERFSDVVEVEQWPECVTVEEENLPERIGVEMRQADACRHHGWKCPLWVRELEFCRTEAAR